MFQTQEADTDEAEEKRTEEDESEDGKPRKESRICVRDIKITAQHSDDLRRVFIPVRYSDSCVHLFSSIK